MRRMYVVFVVSYYNKLLFSLLLLLFPVAILAQDKYHVVDAETGEALDGVLMYACHGDFFNVKEDYIDKQDVQDAILFVYKANVTDSHENYRDHTPTVITKDIYYAVWFENIYLNDDGSAYVDLSNGYLSTKQNTKFGYYIFTYAYETIDFLKKYAVTPNLEKYVIEENITG